MALPITILDGGGTGMEARVSAATNGFDTPDGLVVYTDSLLHFNPFAIPFIDATGSTEMAVDGTFGGTPVVIHNGTDTVAWTGTALSGTWVFDSTAQAQAGTKSVDATATVNGDEASFAKGSDLNFGNYVAVSGYVYLTGYNATRNSINMRFRDNGLDVGNPVNIVTYVNAGLLNAWQKFSIPKEDLGIAGDTVDEMIIQTATTTGAPPDYYLDTMQVEETGGKIFKSSPAVGQTFVADRIRLTMVDALAGTLTDGTMPALSYNQFLGVSALAAGLTLTLHRKGQIIFKDTWASLSDPVLLWFDLKVAISDGTNTLITLDGAVPGGAVMEEAEGDFFELSFSDDLSGLITFKSVLIGRTLIQ